jgi:hypothetical protein
MSELRQKIDELKRRWRERITTQTTAEGRYETMYRIISHTLKSLYLHRRDPWNYPPIAAAFEFAIEKDYKAMFDGIWLRMEVEGSFRCSGEMPEEIVGRSVMMGPG